MSGLSDETLAANKQAYAECARLAPLLLADFYPLTPYSLQPDQWIAWQFNRPEFGEGAIQAFRRAECAGATTVIKFQGLDPKLRYRIEDLDASEAQVLGGRELMTEGYSLQITNKPGAEILMYSRVASS